MKEQMVNPQQKQLNILLLGDQCVDVYQYGVVEKISPEAPVPVFVPKEKISKPGMAANVAQNLKNLGADVFSVFGSPSIKTRLVDLRYNHQLMRIDEDVISNPIDYDSQILPCDVDGIVISDYNKGAITDSLVERLLRDYDCPIYVDTKKTNLDIFERCIVKVNKLEASQLDKHYDNVIITQGGESVIYKEKKYQVKNTNVFDVTGAGDTFLSAFAIRHLQTNKIDESIKFAIDASAVTVQHFGVYAPTTKEIYDEIRRSN
jgi:D-beta-D-heptose 7-phosphate kinase/D-beta-D-heptose 1-phosphate adenosyltransferase